MVIAIVADLVSDPEVPVTFNEYEPRTSVSAVRVKMLAVFAGLELHVDMTPAGSPETDRFTLPSNPPPP